MDKAMLKIVMPYCFQEHINSDILDVSDILRIYGLVDEKDTNEDIINIRSIVGPPHSKKQVNENLFSPVGGIDFFRRIGSIYK